MGVSICSLHEISKNCNSIAETLCYICKVRFIATILSILFLSLSFIPCDDVANASESEEHIVQSYAHQNNDSDLCSPFCQCHCCHSHVVVQDLQVFDIANSCYFTTNFKYLEKNTLEFSDRFIPPPQV
ncbi:DUF6660 family protein [Zunongwangia sp.]|uniref:DUF6660 family protein n=1 Tax=Zunongwangia sp. TaxID=1965325 RepID=UPI003AA871B3